MGFFLGPLFDPCLRVFLVGGVESIHFSSRGPLFLFGKGFLDGNLGLGGGRLCLFGLTPVLSLTDPSLPVPFPLV